MNVAFVNRMFGLTRGGGEMWDLNIANELRERGVEVTFVVGKPLRSELRYPIESFPSIEIPVPHLRDLAYGAPQGVGGILTDLDTAIFTRRATAVLQDKEFDIIHVSSRPEFGRFASQFEVPVAIKLSSTPYSLWYDVLNPVSSSYALLEMFDAVIANGSTSEVVQKQISTDLVTINPGVDTNRFSNRGHQTQSAKTILFVGRFVPAKNLTLLVEAFADLRQQHPKAELILIGDGPLRNQIKSRAVDLGIAEYIQMPGVVENKDLPHYYRKASVFALSSRHESFGIVLLEAMSCGTPVVAPKVGWAPELIDHGKSGLLYEKNSEEQLTEALDTILDNPDLQHRFGKIGQQRVANKFDWKQRAKKVKQLYRHLIDNK